MKKLSFNDKRITVLLKFLCENNKFTMAMVSHFFEDIDDYLLDIINKGLNFEGEHANGYFRINFKPDTFLDYGDRNSDMLEITKIIDGNKQVMNLYYGLLDRNTKPAEISPFVLMEIKGVFDETEILNENFEYRNTFFWAFTEKGELEMYYDNMTTNHYDQGIVPIKYPLRTDVLEESYPRKGIPQQIENNYNLFGDTLLMAPRKLPYYNAYKKMFENDVNDRRRRAFFGDDYEYYENKYNSLQDDTDDYEM